MIKKNDVLKSKDTGYSAIRIIDIKDDSVLYCIVGDSSYHKTTYHCTLSELERNYVIPKSVWEPELGDKYWFINADQDYYSGVWDGDEIDKNRRDFLGVFETRELAEQALAEIKEKIKK